MDAGLGVPWALGQSAPSVSPLLLKAGRAMGAVGGSGGGEDRAAGDQLGEGVSDQSRCFQNEVLSSFKKGLTTE